METFKIIGDDLFFEGYRIAALESVPASIREKFEQAIKVKKHDEYEDDWYDDV